MNQSPEAILAYTDEDCIDSNGVRRNPWFKPDWNPDLFLVQDYVSSCYVCRREWYEQYQAVFEREGMQLALTQLLPLMSVKAVRHLPLVLAHSIHNHANSEVQMRFLERRRRILQEVLGARASVLRDWVSGWHIQHALPDDQPLVSLLIPTRDGLSVLKPCVDSILENRISSL
ncbi:MAG: hypothetical protein R3E95_21290 [Thiolinea sp.]